jgi:hypothetical protein
VYNKKIVPVTNVESEMTGCTRQKAVAVTVFTYATAAMNVMAAYAFH